VLPYSFALDQADVVPVLDGTEIRAAAAR